MGSMPRVSRLHSVFQAQWFQLGGIALLALAFPLWAALEGNMTFNSDQALGGLSARLLLEGYWYPYALGQNYYGDLYSFFILPFLLLFGKTSVVALRMPYIILLGIGYFIHLVWIDRIWGRRAAIVAGLLLAVPSFAVISWVKLSVFNYVLVPGSLCLLLTAREKPFHYRTALYFGFLVGLGTWLSPVFPMYAVPLLVVSFLRSPEWHTLYTHTRRIFGKFLPWLLTLVTLASFLAVLFYFGNGAQIQKVVALRFLIAIFILIIAGMMLTSRRKRVLLLLWVSFILGMIIGNVPQWVSAIWLGVPAISHLSMSVPQGKIVAYHLLNSLPMMLGISATPTNWQMPGFPLWEMVWWSLAFILLLGGFIAFLWMSRKSIGSLLSLTPLDEARAQSLPILIMAGLPVLFFFFYADTSGDIVDTRHLLTQWPVLMTMIAIPYAHLLKKKFVQGILLFSLLVLLLGAGTARMRWNIHYRSSHAVPTQFAFFWRPSPFDQSSVEGVRQLLQFWGAKGGYGDYWTVYALDFLLGDDITLAPYNGTDRYFPYIESVKESPIFAILVEPSSPVLPENADHAMLTKTLRERVIWLIYEPFARVADRIDQAQVLHRQQIGTWDVWILRDLPKDL